MSDDSSNEPGSATALTRRSLSRDGGMAGVAPPSTRATDRPVARRDGRRPRVPPTARYRSRSA